MIATFLDQAADAIPGFVAEVVDHIPEAIEQMNIGAGP